MSTQDMRRLAALALFLFGFADSAAAAVAVHVVRTDLKPLIRAAADTPVQFAVLVPHAVSVRDAGTWSVAGGQATWRYAVRVPTAVSLSFHATQSSLPRSATLMVQGTKSTTTYGSRDLSRGELWSRIHPGDALQFTLTVATVDRDKLSLHIVSLQAGYRALGAGVQDHPYYRQLRAQALAASDNTACVTNYECKVSASNTSQGAATVGLIVGNLYECTGSLINNVPGDNSPYVLTARHCESGKLGGGNPGAAASVTIYWDATTACGGALGSLYDSGIPTQTGGQTVVEQQDAWLIKLDVNPVASDAQFTGFDASGGAVQGGYTVHHAEFTDKQFVAWFGQAFALQESGTLGTNYVSNFWETVNQLGNIGPGASGSGLFDQNSHLVGLLSLGRQTSDPSGYGSCPVAPPPQPNGSNGVADFTSLAAVWNSTADTTSSTGTATLKSVLDPANTGTLVVPSAAVANIALFASVGAQIIGQPLVLTWSAGNPAQCIAQGGVAGDGWAGALAASGSLSLTESAINPTTYTLACTYAGARTAKASVSVDWVGPTPTLQFSAPHAVWTTRPAVLSWISNVAPCSISGGGLSASGLPSTGTTTTTQATPGDVTYAITCGPANNHGSAGATVSYVTPSVTLEPVGSDRILGEPFALLWGTYADSCAPSGGAPNDGWSTTAFSHGNTYQTFAPDVTTLGTYTYTLTCSSGPISVSQSVSVTFENNAPYASASLTSSSVTFTDSPADYVSFSWKSNLTNCNFTSNPSLAYSLNDPFNIPGLPESSVTLNPPLPGAYVLSVSCYTPGTSTTATSTPVTLTVLPPPPPTATISLSPASVLEGNTYTVTWSSTNASWCASSGGTANDGWDGYGVFGRPPTGTYTYAPGGPGQVGNFTFGIECESIAPNVPTASAQAHLTVENLTATLQASSGTVTQGSSFTLKWSSTGASSCSAGGGGADPGTWKGALATAGTLMVSAKSLGDFTYSIACMAGPGWTIQAQANVTVMATSGGSGGAGAAGGGGGGGGGGAIAVLELALLAGWIFRRVWPQSLALGRSGRAPSPGDL